MRLALDASSGALEPRDYTRAVPFRFYRRRSLGRGFWVGASKSGVSVGRRGRRFSTSAGRRGVSGSVRLLKGLSYVFRRR